MNNRRLASILLCLQLCGSACSSHILPRAESHIVGNETAALNAENTVTLEPVHLFPPSATYGSRSYGIASTKADANCRARSLGEGELSQLALVGFTQSFAKVYQVPSGAVPQSKKAKENQTSSSGIRVIPSILEINCGVEAASASVFAPLLLFTYSRLANPVTVRAQAIVVDERTSRVLFVLEHAGEFEESVTSNFGIFLLYASIIGEDGRPPEDAYRAAFAGLAREVNRRLTLER